MFVVTIETASEGTWTRDFDSLIKAEDYVARMDEIHGAGMVADIVRDYAHEAHEAHIFNVANGLDAPGRGQ
jgi:hypothetical protein